MLNDLGIPDIDNLAHEIGRKRYHDMPDRWQRVFCRLELLEVAMAWQHEAYAILKALRSAEYPLPRLKHDFLAPEGG